MFTKLSLSLLVLAAGLALAVAPSTPAVAATAADYSITVTHVTRTDTVVGTAKNVGGRWVVVLEWRESGGAPWQLLAQSAQQRGRSKARVANVVRSPGVDSTGRWRTCVVKGPAGGGGRKTCGRAITVR